MEVKWRRLNADWDMIIVSLWIGLVELGAICGVEKIINMDIIIFSKNVIDAIITKTNWGRWRWTGYYGAPKRT